MIIITFPDIGTIFCISQNFSKFSLLWYNIVTNNKAETFLKTILESEMLLMIFLISSYASD